MKKLGILLDSFGGISEKEINLAGFEMLPLQFTIDGKDYLDNGDQFNNMQIAEMVRDAKEAKTSLPSVASIEEKIEKMSKEYENVIVLTLSSVLSSTFNTVSTFAKEFDNVHPIDNHFCGDEALEIAKYIVKKAEEGVDIKRIIEFIKKVNSKSLNYLIPKNLDALIRGGRLTGVKKMLLTSLKLIPLLKVDASGISFGGLKRSVESSMKKVVDKLVDFANAGDKLHDEYEFKFIYAGDPEILEIGKKVLNDKHIPIQEPLLASAIVAIHTGYGCASIAIWPKLEKIEI